MNTWTRAREYVLDTWSALSHKGPLRDEQEARVNGWTGKSWVGDEHRRRLAAYTVLAAYEANVAREFLSTTDQSDRDDRREYGDAGLVLDTVIAALIGETQEIVVDGADDYDPHYEAPEGDDPAPGDVDAAADNERARRLAERQDFLQTWADDVHLQLRLTDCARNEAMYGDGVWLLGWDADRGRPVPAVMDPGFYFPVLPDTLDSYDYPTRVHFAWEIPAEEFPDRKIRVRRITYDLRPIAPLRVEGEDGGDLVETLPDGASWRNRGDGVMELVRTYPWSTEPSRLTCYLTDATWVLDDLQDPESVDAFTTAGASFRVGDDGTEFVDYDLEFDFIPVVHVPNTPAGGGHYGQSSLARVLQLLDDLQSADTDAQKAAATTGSPIIGLSGTATMGNDPLTGTRGTEIEHRPGAGGRRHGDLGAGAALRDHPARRRAHQLVRERPRRRARLRRVRARRRPGPPPALRRLAPSLDRNPDAALRRPARRPVG